MIPANQTKPNQTKLHLTQSLVEREFMKTLIEKWRKEADRVRKIAEEYQEGTPTRSYAYARADTMLICASDLEDHLMKKQNKK